ncbi:hypothetical protein LA080_006602 [Diaporthe eres]|nr:hypothetical protein LA080_006602 [Diaporthe eres]
MHPKYIQGWNDITTCSDNDHLLTNVYLNWTADVFMTRDEQKRESTPYDPKGLVREGHDNSPIANDSGLHRRGSHTRPR